MANWKELIEAEKARAATEEAAKNAAKEEKRKKFIEESQSAYQRQKDLQLRLVQVTGLAQKLTEVRNQLWLGGNVSSEDRSFYRNSQNYSATGYRLSFLFEGRRALGYWTSPSMGGVEPSNHWVLTGYEKQMRLSELSIVFWDVREKEDILEGMLSIRSFVEGDGCFVRYDWEGNRWTDNYRRFFEPDKDFRRVNSENAETTLVEELTKECLWRVGNRLLVDDLNRRELPKLQQAPLASTLQSSPGKRTWLERLLGLDLD